MIQLTKDFQNLDTNEKKNNKKHKNKKKEKNKNSEIEPEKPKEEFTEEEKFRDEINNTKEKLRELKILFTQNEAKDLYEDKLDNFILIPKIVDYSKIKKKLYECFPNEDIFSYLFDIWNRILNYSLTNNDNNVKNNDIYEENEEFEEKKDKKVKNKSLCYFFNKLLMNLDFFIPKIIVNKKDDSFKNKICETIIPNIQMIKNIEDGENFLYYFIDVFDIKNIFKLKVEKEYKDKLYEIININLCFGLNLINTLDLQELFPIEIIFKIIRDNLYLISYRIYSLISRTYIKNEEKKKFLIIDNLFKLLEDNQNLFDYQLVYEIVNKDFKDYNKRDELILKFINKIKINFDKTIRITILDNAIYYCKLIFENSHLFNKSEIEQAQKYICEKYFNNLKPNDWKTNLRKLNLFEYKDLKDYLNIANLEEYYYKLPINEIEAFIKILKFIPKETKKLLNDLKDPKSFDGAIRIIKKLDIPEHRIPEYFIDERIYKYFSYKIPACRDDNNPYTLIEYCLISQKTFDISILQLINLYKKYNFKNQFFLYVINEVYYGALNEKFKFSKKLKKEIEELYYKIKYVDNYTFDDHLGPIEKNCLQIDRKKTEICFIDNTFQFEDVLKKYFINSKYIGIDTEWRQSFKVKDDIDVSIIQLSTDDEKCCVILDMLKLRWDDKFYDIFKKYLKGKIFIGFSFDRNDMEVLPDELKKFFSDKNSCTIYDLVIIYKQKYLEKCQSLKKVCETILEKSLCKYEQCSDWNKRPLSKCQIHYAALDALVCILLYKKIVGY